LRNPSTPRRSTANMDTGREVRDHQLLPKALGLTFPAISFTVARSRQFSRAFLGPAGQSEQLSAANQPSGDRAIHVVPNRLGVG